jgi:hypothetical protein
MSNHYSVTLIFSGSKSIMYYETKILFSQKNKDLILSLGLASFAKVFAENSYPPFFSMICYNSFLWVKSRKKLLNVCTFA